MQKLGVLTATMALGVAAACATVALSAGPVTGQTVEPGGTEIDRSNAPKMQVVKPNAFGVLRLSLRPDSYSWRFVSVAGRSFTDSGTERCH